MRLSIILLVTFCVTACSPAWKISHKLRKADKLIKEAIALGAVIKSDTVYKEKTVTIPGDSVKVEIPIWSKVRDTVIYKDRAVLKIRNVHDTIRITAECLPDTVRISVPVTINRSIICPEQTKTWRTVAFVLIGLLALLVFLVARK